MRTATTKTAILAITALALALAGCSASGTGVDDALNDAIDEAAEAAEQLESALPEVDLDDVEADAEDILNEVAGDDTSIDLDTDGDISVPADFPAGLPLPEGELQLALADPGTWSLSYAIADAGVAEALAAEFAADPGYMALEEAETGGMHVWAFLGSEYYVNVGLMTAADGTLQLVYGATEGVE